MKRFFLGAITMMVITWASHLFYLNTDSGTLHGFVSKLDDILNGQIVQFWGK